MVRVASDIADLGWALVTVQHNQWSWSHTIGLAERGLPELVIANLKVDFAKETLHTVAGGLTVGLSFENLGEISDLTFGDVHRNHLRNGLVSAWDGYYSHPDKAPRLATTDFLQVIPGPTYFCKTNQRRKLDLSSPDTSILGINRPQHFAGAGRRAA